jgi:hypothetical protein
MGRHGHLLSIDIRGACTTGSAARNLLADVMAALGSDDTFGGTCTYSDITSTELLIEEAADTIAGCRISLSVVYHLPLWRM